ncbi:hypothetical protein GGQ84_003042 [Desulfitispora alkaliphila]|uniref:ATP-grasp domain-containing protein n=1 Tax=Desulfitispora alkaliphila TaxID=622674 RepID=UPI003D1C1C3B
MIILDKPYVSTFLEETIVKLDLPVLNNGIKAEFNLSNKIKFLDDKEFVKRFQEKNEGLVYTNSENSINWITNNLSFTDLPQKIEVFKDKVKFRELLKSMHPNFFYQEVGFDNLDEIDVTEIEMPFIIKPSIGFFSMGVYKVSSISQWRDVVNKLKKEVNSLADNYPAEVINTNKFIIEENIEGEEFAVDVYYDNEGKPVILNILKHIFSSREDVSDRLYITSKEIIEKYYSGFTSFLSELGKLINLKGFPMHIEFRIDKDENIVPIEVNPMRFAGWCTTDIAYYAYGINIYEYFLKQKKPLWEEILKDKEGKTYSIVIADLPRDVKVATIEGIDYDKFKSYFENPLEMRKVDYIKHGVFAFLFAETSEGNWQEIDGILKSDLKEYLKFKD